MVQVVIDTEQLDKYVMPCKHCGSYDAPRIFGGDGDGYIVTCEPFMSGCGIRTLPFETRRQAVFAWNRRPED